MNLEDKLAEMVAMGTQADAVLGVAGKTCHSCGSGSSIFLERENQIIKEMIASFRAGESNPHVFMRYAAALAEVRALEDALDYRSRKGTEARTKLYGSTEEPTPTA